MGEIADDYADGTICGHCGTFFEDTNKPDELISHGYPVLCWDCWKESNKHERKGFSRSLYPDIGSSDEEDENELYDCGDS